MKIYIDDIRNPPDESWLVFRCSKSALHFVQTNLDQITEISFDHDLGGEDTTKPIATFLEKAAFESGKKFNILTMIHSANGPGRIWLAHALRRSTNLHE